MQTIESEISARFGTSDANSSDTARTIQRNLTDRSIPASMLGLDQSSVSPQSESQTDELQLANPFKPVTPIATPQPVVPIGLQPINPPSNPFEPSAPIATPEPVVPIGLRPISLPNNPFESGTPVATPQPPVKSIYSVGDSLAISPVQNADPVFESGGTTGLGHPAPIISFPTTGISDSGANGGITGLGHPEPIISFPPLTTQTAGQLSGEQSGAGASASPPIEASDQQPPQIPTFSDSSPPVTTNSQLAPGESSSADPGMATLDSSDSTNPSDSSASTSQPAWTYLVDLAESYGQGTPNEAQQFQALAQQTEGTNSQVIVQSVAPGGVLNTYVMKDGQTTEMAPTQSQGTAADIQTLLSEAPSTGQTALFVQAHGSGSGGVLGDNGDASVDDLTSAIQNGMSAAGISQLATLDFDSCNMADAQALNQFAPMAQNIVASENTENITLDSPTTSNTGQDIFGTLSNVLTNPAANGTALGNALVAQSDSSTNANESGTTELASFNTSALPQLNDAVNNFATALDTATNASATNTQGIEVAIGATPDLGDSNQNRDVGTIAKNVIDGINNGTIQDPDGKLQQAASSLISAEGSVINSSYSQDATQTGVGVFAPDQSYLDPTNLAIANVDNATQLMAQTSTNLAQILAATSPDGEVSAATLADSMPDLRDNTATSSLLSTNTGSGTLDEYQSLVQSINSQGYATHEQLSNVQSAATDAANQMITSRGSLIAEDFNQAGQGIDSLFGAELPPENGSSTPWSTFINDLANQEANNVIPGPPSAIVTATNPQIPTEGTDIPTPVIPPDTTSGSGDGANSGNTINLPATPVDTSAGSSTSESGGSANDSGASDVASSSGYDSTSSSGSASDYSDLGSGYAYNGAVGAGASGGDGGIDDGFYGYASGS